MKRVVKEIFNSLGFDIVKLQPKQNESSSEENKSSIKSDKLTFHETRTGNYYLPTDAYLDIVVNTIKSNGVFEEEVVNSARKYIPENGTVLDIGANFGQMSILMAEMVGVNGKVYSFEADDFIFEILKKNIQANNKTNIKPVFGAVHDVQDSYLYFPIQDFKKYSSYGSYGIDYVNSQGRKVPTLTIDGMQISEEISFMKIDIQGGDLFAMRGAVNTIAKNRMPILFEFEYLMQDDLNLKFQDYVDFVKEIDYHFERVIYGQNFLILPNI